MSEATKELIAEIRENHQPQSRGDGKPLYCAMCVPVDYPCDATRLADALEARQPTEDDRVFLIDLIREHDLAADENTSPRDYRAGLALGILATGFYRAAVPDAATERDMLGRAAFAAIVASGEDTDGAGSWQAYFRPLKFPSWVDAVHQNVTSLAEERDRAESESLNAEAERDAALAAVERVRAIHQPTGGIKIPRTFAGEPEEVCRGCLQIWPCPTVAALPQGGIVSETPFLQACGVCDDYGVKVGCCTECGCPTRAALDGAPEPEWEYQWIKEPAHPLGATQVAHVYHRHEYDEYVERHGGRVERRRKAGPWLPIEKEQSNER